MVIGQRGAVQERLNNMDQYKTKDLAEIVGFILEGVPVADVVAGSPGYAYFDETVALEETKKRFWNGDLRVDPIQYELRRKMMINKLMI